MYEILLFEKFLDKNQLCDYEFKRSYDAKDKYDNDINYSIYEIIDPVGNKFILNFWYYYADGELTLDWADENQFNLKMKNKIDKYVKSEDLKNYNYNNLYKVINTIFYILSEYVKSNYKIIKCISIGSYTKSKYRLYKEIISEMPEFKITKDETTEQNGMKFHCLTIKYNKYKMFFRNILKK